MNFKMEAGFSKGDSSNLPKVDMFMIAGYFANNPNYNSAEFRNIKLSMSSRSGYGESAIGYVQVKREGSNCTVKCKITAEHKVRNKPYDATLAINEVDDQIISLECHGCVASLGGCKHAVALIFWAYRRSEEPSCTTVTCYWRKSKPSKVGSTLKCMMAKPPGDLPSNSNVLNIFLKDGKKLKVEGCELLSSQEDHVFTDEQSLGIHLLVSLAKEQNVDTFLKNIVLKEAAISSVEKLTREQSECSLWFEMRYGRITASKCYEISRCHTSDGALVSQIMGGKFRETLAMRQGRITEHSVREVVSNSLRIKFDKCGLRISSRYPWLAGSPDGISCDGTRIVEIKCVSSNKNIVKYIKDKRPTPKFFAQMQFQMFLTGAKVCHFCVADCLFATNHKVDIITVEYDEVYVNNLLPILEDFWKTNVYPLLYRTAVM